MEIQEVKDKFREALIEFLRSNEHTDDIHKFTIACQQVYRQGTGLVYSEVREIIKEVIEPEPTSVLGEYGTCEQCEVNQGVVQIDPYNADINNEDIEMCLCDDCYNERVMDI